MKPGDHIDRHPPANRPRAAHTIEIGAEANSLKKQKGLDNQSGAPIRAWIGAIGARNGVTSARIGVTGARPGVIAARVRTTDAWIERIGAPNGVTGAREGTIDAPIEAMDASHAAIDVRITATNAKLRRYNRKSDVANAAERYPCRCDDEW